MESAKKKILIVDDDPSILDFLSLFLEDVGYDVETADNGATIGDFPNGLPDLLLLDVWLSGQNGRDICLSLKNQQTTQYLPVILISANNDLERITREARANDFLPKPFNLDDILKKIECHLSDDRQQEAQSPE